MEGMGQMESYYPNLPNKSRATYTSKVIFWGVHGSYSRRATYRKIPFYPKCFPEKVAHIFTSYSLRHTLRLTNTVVIDINSADMVRLFIIKLGAVAYTCLCLYLNNLHGARKLFEMRNLK